MKKNNRRPKKITSLTSVERKIHNTSYSLVASVYTQAACGASVADRLVFLGIECSDPASGCTKKDSKKTSSLKLTPTISYVIRDSNMLLGQNNMQ